MGIRYTVYLLIWKWIAAILALHLRCDIITLTIDPRTSEFPSMKVYLPERPPRANIPNVVLFKRPAAPLPAKLQYAHEAFRKWLGQDWDVQMLNVLLATASANRLRGDPLWLMIVGGSGAGKTELIYSLQGCGGHIISTITSEGALLSATSSKDKAAEATGGILQVIGSRGLLGIKDFTSILSMPAQTMRPAILAALREVHDGRWIRNVGTDGGRTLSWEGHLGIVSGCTTVWDTSHSAVATMGDRFVVCRIDTTDPDSRMAAGKQAMLNIGHEREMRRELEQAVGLVVGAIGPNTVIEEPSAPVYSHMLEACNIASKARTPVETDYQGKVTYSHDPESPTRLTKSLMQMIRGALAMELSLDDAFDLALRCARDSIPPIRLECMCDMAQHADCRPSEVASRIDRPWKAVDRAMSALHSARILSCTKASDGESKPKWLYNIADWIKLEHLWPGA